jgi:DNA invertase Pin-like site-specific DNA recombinase
MDFWEVKMKLRNTYKVGIYCRLSRDDNNGSNESMSISNQRDMLMSYVNERGWEVSEIYVDDGYSGTTFDRPDFQRMIRDVELKKINMIITKDLSRLGRNYVMTGQYTEFFFPQNGIRFIAINDNVDTVHEDNDIAPFKNILNEMYAKDISKKVKSARVISARQGKFMGSKPPYGYIKSPSNKHLLIIDDTTAPIVRQIFTLYAMGEPARCIVQKLNSDGILAPRAYHYKQLGCENSLLNEREYWGTATIMQMLQNQVYAGHMVQGNAKLFLSKLSKEKLLQKMNG